MLRPLLFLIALASGAAALSLWLDLPGRMGPALTVSDAPGPATPATPAGPVEALVALRDLAPGERLDTGSVGWAEVRPDAPAAAGLTLRSAMPDAPTEVLGLSVMQAVPAGGAVLWGNLTSAGEGGGDGALAARIAPDHFALAIVVSEATAAGGLILPGDRVDLLALRGEPGGARRAEVIAADVGVLAVDQTLQRPAGAGGLPGRTLTLELTAEQVPLIGAANAAGGLSVALRSARRD